MKYATFLWIICFLITIYFGFFYEMPEKPSVVVLIIMIITTLYTLLYPFNSIIDNLYKKIF